MLDAFVLAISLVYIIDISGVMAKVNRAVFACLYGKKIAYNGWYVPLVGCSKCSVWWAVLIYTFFATATPALYCLGMACLYSYISIYIGDILKLCNRLIINKLSDISVI
jgi:hypothetical protein